MKCKYPDKKCNDRYLRQGCEIICRLPEWKKRAKTCPYDETIKSKQFKIKTKDMKKLTEFK